MRLIDADQLIKYLNSVAGCFDSTREVEENTVDAINEQPTVDAVPVVRCMNCKYFLAEDRACDLFYSCTEADDFCSSGERRQEHETN